MNRLLLCTQLLTSTNRCTIMFVESNLIAQYFVRRIVMIVQSFVPVKHIITNFCKIVKYVQNGVHHMAEMYEIIDTLLKERGISGAQMSADL